VKFFTLIYALYILALPLFPCGDKDDCIDEKAETSIAKQNNTEQQNHEHEDENCSPFCTCMCCGQVITNLFYPVNSDINKKYFISKSTSSYNNNFRLPSYLDRIWQPPKFS
jgi:hypothetical protein